MSSKGVEKNKNGANVGKTYEFDPYMREQKKVTWGNFFYDSSNGAVFGRTGKNWAQLGLFYLIFYSVLAALCAICMQGLFASLSDDHPTWQLEESLIGTNPGLGFRPISAETERGSLIWYNAAKKDEVDYWVNTIDEFLQPYVNKSATVNGGTNHVHCDFDQLPKYGQVCIQDVTTWGDCSKIKGYSYNSSSPCIFLKLNKIYGWVPQYYDDVDNLPADMPADIVAHIKTLPVKERKQIWISCQGEHPVDREILGPVSYIKYGFPGYFYPYINTPGYLSPLVVVKFDRPKTNQVINVECRAWAKNIHYIGGTRDRAGSVHLEIMIDDYKSNSSNSTKV